MSLRSVKCPNCNQMIQGDIEQVFDVSEETNAKQTLLNGNFNVVKCPMCSYQGRMAVPIVYHDQSEELLLTFVPPDLGLSRDDQERAIGKLINQVMDKLPQEKRKAYLLSPQTMLTMESLVEKVLEADGITKEMIEDQQERMKLIQRLLNTTEDSREEIIEQEDENIDATIFSMLSQLIEVSNQRGERESAEQLQELQEQLLMTSTFGKRMKAQSEEVEAAIASLNEAGEDLTREKLLEIIIKAPNDDRISALVSLVRKGIDYTFFQMLSDRIDRARSSGRTRLIKLRKRLLELTEQYDQQLEVRLKQAKTLLDKILESDDVKEETLKNVPTLDEFFFDVLNQEVEAAKNDKNEGKLEKLNIILQVIQDLSAAGEDVEFYRKLIEIPDEKGRTKFIEENRDRITPEFINLLTNVISQAEKIEDNEQAIEQLKQVHSQVLEFSMKERMQEK